MDKKVMIINDDILNWCKEYKGEKFHSLVCDPPYELNFMNKGWDNTGIAFKKETWEALKEHLHPGAFCFAFASTRGLHRMMVAIEDAGFVIHPTIFLYAFGSGFPKATRIDTQIQSKEEQEVVGTRNPHIDGGKRTNYGLGKDGLYKGGFEKKAMQNGEIEVLQPTDPLAKRWIGHRYGLQALKPAVEPIICFQKRYEGKPVNCIVETGAGALNIDGGRIKIDKEPRERWKEPSGKVTNYKSEAKTSYGMGNNRQTTIAEYGLKGRWPSNLIIDKECAERFPMTADGHQTINNDKRYLTKKDIEWNVNFRAGDRCPENSYSDSGSAARYFKNVEMKIDAADPVFYTSKVSRDERQKGCEKLEKLDPHTTYANDEWSRNNFGNCPTNKREKINNNHPCLKSIDLCTYLATLLLPPLEYAPRRILVPFAGAGSEMIGCLKAGWEEIVGIELIEEYIPIIEARFEYYRKQIELEKEQQIFTPEIMESMKQEKLFE
jgi:site-specific DNA-methyltransferase (adenine-specific)